MASLRMYTPMTCSCTIMLINIIGLLFIVRLSTCVGEISEWMASNRLCLNPTKTEIIWLGSTRRIANCPVDPQDIAGAMIVPFKLIRDLGVMVDDDLTLTAHVNHLSSSCFYQLRQLRAIRRSLSTDIAHALVRALVHSRLDYCNGVLAGMPKYNIDRLQSVLRSAARLTLRLPGSASVTDLMRRQLHWLPNSGEDILQTVHVGIQMPAQPCAIVSD